MKYSNNELINIVCHQFNLQPVDILTQDRHKTVAKARHIAIYLCYVFNKISLFELGDVFHRDHTTILHSLQLTRRQYKYRNEIRNIIKDL